MSKVEDNYFVKTRITEDGKGTDIFDVKGSLRRRLPLGLSIKVVGRSYRTYGQRWEAEHIAKTMEELLWEDALDDLTQRERQARK